MITLDSISAANASIEIQTAAGQALDIDASGFLTVKGNGDFTVTATQLDIDDLSSANDNVEIQTAAGQALDIDGSGFITANQGGDWSFTLDNISTWKNTSEAVTAAAAELVSSPLVSRNSITIQNVGNNDAFLGPDGTVTTSGATQGLKLPKGSSGDFGFDSTADIFAIGSGNTTLIVSEYAA